MPTSKRKDFTQVAFDVAQCATGGAQTPTPTERQESGRKGGLKGGVARTDVLSPEQRSEIARLAAQARWTKG